MTFRLDDLQHTTEFQEVLLLSRLQRVLLEEWNDTQEEMFESPYPVRHPVAVIPANHTTAEVRLEGMKNVNIPFVLRDGEFRKYLETRSHVGMPVDPHLKAAFPVDEPDDPLRFEIHSSAPNVQPLRLLACTPPFP